MVSTYDDVNSAVVSTVSKYYSLNELVSIYRKTPDLLSSAIFRVLDKYSKDESAKEVIDKVIAECKSGQKNEKDI